MNALTRRQFVAGTAGVALAQQPSRPPGLLIETHIHLFADDQARFPYHPNAVYKPPPLPLEKYLAFARQARLDHAVIVHPEPYQDDHRYLEYCFEREPSPGFFKGTCLFDPIAPGTPARMEALVKKHRGRIVALRVHETQNPKLPPTTTGAIRDRDMRSPAMLAAWRKAHSLGLAIQMHFIPYYAPQIFALASQLKEMPVVLDHLGRYGEGTPAQYEEVFKLASLPRVYMKFSALNYSSKKGYPYRDLQPLVERVFKAFGPDRIIWGVLGSDMGAFEKQVAVFTEMFAFTSEANRAKLRGLNAARLYGFPLK